MKLKRLYLVSMAIIILFSGMVYSKDQKIYLEKAKLPDGWSIIEAAKVSESTVDRYSELFEVEVKSKAKYTLQIEKEILQIDIMQCSTETGAQKVYEKLVRNKEDKTLNYQKQGSKVIQYTCSKGKIIKEARELNLVSNSPIIFSKEYTKEIDFLQHNYTAIDLNEKDFSSFELLDKELKRNKIFLAGEAHRVAASYKLRFKFLKYFKQEAGIKYHLVEMPYSTAGLLNHYLKTGNREILEKIKRESNFVGTEEEYKYWQKVYQFNKSLPEGEKLKLVGIDIGREPSNAIWYLYSLLPNKKPPSTIAPMIEGLKIMYKERNYHNKNIKKFITRLKRDLQVKSKHYQNFLGDKIFDFKLVSDNVLTEFNCSKKGNTPYVIREKQIYKNFKKIYSRSPQSKFYGQFGLNHVLQKSSRGQNWLASKLTSPGSSVEGRVLSIAYLYKDCKQMRVGKGKPWKYNTYNSPINLEQFTETNLTLFKLTGKNSPFEKKLYWIDKPSGGVTTDYYQYVVLIKNSEAATVFKE